jgi:hypothetical protein
MSMFVALWRWLFRCFSPSQEPMPIDEFIAAFEEEKREQLVEAEPLYSNVIDLLPEIEKRSKR